MRSEVRGPKSEVRGPKSEVLGPDLALGTSHFGLDEGRRWKVVGDGDLCPTTYHLRPIERGVALIGRAAVSKTVGWGFESLHPCHEGA